MIIDSIRFENFKVYYGEVDFSFPVEGERNVSIIFADNDVGKSCFFSGIIFCLYGEKNNENLKDLININAQQEGIYRAAVSIFATHGGSKIEITRIIEPRGKLAGQPKSKDLKSKLNLVKDGCPLNVSVEEKVDFINSIVHEDAAQYFFFDGEKINDYSTASGSKYKEAIARILGIKEIENAIEDLCIIKKEFEKERDNWVSKKESYRDVLKKKNEIVKEIDKLNELIINYEKEIDVARETIQKNEDELKKFKDIREKVEKKQNLSKEIDVLLSKLDEQRNLREECFKANATLILAAIAFGKFKQGNDQAATENYISSAVKDHLLYLIKQPVCVCGETLDDYRIQAIRTYIDKNFVSDERVLLEKERENLFNACEKYREKGIESKAEYLLLSKGIYDLTVQLCR